MVKCKNAKNARLRYQVRCYNATCNPIMPHYSFCTVKCDRFSKMRYNAMKFNIGSYGKMQKCEKCRTWGTKSDTKMQIRNPIMPHYSFCTVKCDRFSKMRYNAM